VSPQRMTGPSLPALPSDAMAPAALTQPVQPDLQVAALDDVQLPRDDQSTAVPALETAALDIDIAPSAGTGAPDSKIDEMAAAARDDTAPVRSETLPEAVAQPACDIAMSASPTVAAMVEVSIDAPCLVNERVTLHHNGMMITEATDEAGQLSLTVPALAEQAVFIAAFANGMGAMARTDVGALPLYDRVVLQWKGTAGLQIHALEYGAKYFSNGHVWAEASRNAEAASQGTGGFIVPLGNADAPEPLLAEVYTFPTGTARKAGTIDLSVEAEVTDLNCGREVAAQTLEIHGGDLPRVKDLTLPMPGCDATGDYLVLKNLLQDLSIAAK